MKQHTSPVPHFGVVTTPDQIEGVMPPIEEKIFIKSASNQVLTGITNPSSLIDELSQSESKCTNNSNINLSSTSHLNEIEGQTSDENKNVSKQLFNHLISIILFI